MPLAYEMYVYIYNVNQTFECVKLNSVFIVVSFSDSLKFWIQINNYALENKSKVKKSPNNFVSSCNAHACLAQKKWKKVFIFSIKSFLVEF